MRALPPSSTKELSVFVQQGYLRLLFDASCCVQAVADEITAAVADVRSSLEGENPEDIKEKVSNLQKATMKIGEAMQGQSQQQTPPESEQQQGTGEEKKE